MATVLRVMAVAVMLVMPGGLLLVTAFVLAALVTERMRLEQGSGSRRLARAFATVRLRDAWRKARSL